MIALSHYQTKHPFQGKHAGMEALNLTRGNKVSFEAFCWTGAAVCGDKAVVVSVIPGILSATIRTVREVFFYRRDVFGVY